LGEREGKAVVCLSGGMDSCVCAALAAACHESVYFLHGDYGQRTEKVERERFHALADYFGAAGRLVCNLDHLGKIGGSSLTDKSIQVSDADLDSAEIPSSYVPFRNAHFLTVAVSWAEVLGAGSIYVGAVEQDGSGYPDCRREFYDAFEKVVEIGTKPETRIEILTPLIELKKSEIVLLGQKLGAPFQLTWSCYQSEDLACGICDSCALRLRAFREAAIEDPVPYRG
jgi:7-cyano-7-deazaguanine synthase